jgi:hypothetical protein
MPNNDDALLVYDVDKENWELKKDYFDETASILIPAGFRCDLASIPRPLWWLIAPFELSEQAPLVHDYLYRNAGKLVPVYGFSGNKIAEIVIDKEKSDKYFLWIMERENVKAWKRKAAYFAVKHFAGGVWKKRRANNEK